MAKTKAAKVSPQTQGNQAEENVRMAAYLNWERETGGNPVDEEATRQFWLSAEQQLSLPDQTNGNNGDR